MTVCVNCSKHGKTVWEEPATKPALIRSKAFISAPKMQSKKAPAPPTETTVELIENYGSKMKEAREKLGISHEELGKKLNEKISLLRKIETGKMTPDNNLATKLERALKIKLIVPAAEEKEKIPQKIAKDSSRELTLGDLIKLDKQRKNKASNDDWENPHDPDAKITKMKDGRTHLAHKAEHAVDMETGAVVAVTLQPADRGDTSSVQPTVEQVDQNLVAVMLDDKACHQLSEQVGREVVADKGYHSSAVLGWFGEHDIRTYISEPARGRRRWQGNTAEQHSVYANRRRIRGRRGKSLLRRRGELVERSFAHCYDTGGMRRTHLKRHDNILKRLLIHVAGFNLSLILRKLFGWGTARALQGLAARVFAAPERVWRRLLAILARLASYVISRIDVTPDRSIAA